MSHLVYDKKNEHFYTPDKTKPKILVVDDENSIRRLLGRMLDRKGYSTTLAKDAKEARNCLRNQTYELILCDVNMPGESGLTLIRTVSAEYPDTAIVMITAVDDPEVAKSAMEIGSYGYIIKPFESNEIINNVANALHRRNLEIENRGYRKELEEKVSMRTAELKKTLDRLNKTIKGIIRAMALALESRDPYTAGHQRRVADLAGEIARHMSLSEERILGVMMAGSIHDLGKLAIPAEILSKPNRLSDAEFSLIKTHPQVGYDILKDIEFPWPVAQMVVQHHEKMDGSGYPRGLSGDEILLESSILAVADVVEAMASHRPYRPSLGINAALDEISKNKGILYHSEVVDVCLKLFREKNISLG